MSEASIELPVLLGGTRVLPQDCGDVQHLTAADGSTIVLPSVDAADLRRTLADARASSELRTLSIDDITIFFDRVGKAWRSEENRWRQLALAAGPAVTGYPRAFVEWDVNLIGAALMRAKQYDFLETDLGDPYVLDQWTSSKAIYRRCWPIGLIAHVMVGNVPMASLFTLYRSLATKNTTIAKLPSRDPLTSLAFANCIYDVDPEHPVTRALSILYWAPDSEIERDVLAAADAVSVWGQATAVQTIKRKVPYGTDVIEFGPKRSVTLVFADELHDYARTAIKMAYDTVLYEQEGCFSMQEAFVVGEAQPLVQALEVALDSYAQRFARTARTVDIDAHIQRARLEAQAMGWQVVAPAGTDWTVIVTDGPCHIEEHPLSRTLYVHPLTDWRTMLRFVDRNVQTVAVSPWDRLWNVADELSAAGADRIVQVGRMARFRPGFIHDGFYPMRRMVRWASIERGLDFKYRFMSIDEDEDERRIYYSGLGAIAEAVST
jgi:long-chain-fatty-acyl-CoA reductase